MEIFLFYVIAAILFGDFLLVSAIILKRVHRQFRYHHHLDKVSSYKVKINESIQNDVPIKIPRYEAIKLKEEIKIALLQCIEEAEDEKQKEKTYQIFRTIGLESYYFHRLNYDNPISRAKAIDAMGNFKVEAAVELIIDAIKDKSKIVTGASVLALGKIGGERSAEVLVGLLKHPIYTRHSMILSLIEKVGTKTVPHLINLLINGEDSLKLEAAKVLGNIGDRRAIPFLTLALESENSNLRAKAAEAIGKLQVVSCLIHLQKLLGDPEWPVRSMAAKALGNMGHSSSLPHLKCALKDEEWWVRRDAAKALLSLGSCGEAGLIEMMKSTDRFARETAAAQLEASGIIHKYSIQSFSDVKADANAAKEILNVFDNVTCRSSQSHKVARDSEKVASKEKSTDKTYQEVG